MPFCGSCGAQVNGSFCPSCGQAATAGAPGAAAPPPTNAQYAPAGAPVAAAGMQENVAGLLCYILGFITGIIFLVLAPYNQNKFVRFHAFQSIFLSVAWVAVVIVEQILNAIMLSISLAMFGLVATIWMLIGLAFLVLWVVLMVKAYNGQKWKLPIIGDLAEKQA
jgi:uncharacterized membrane protein